MDQAPQAARSGQSTEARTEILQKFGVAQQVERGDDLAGAGAQPTGPPVFDVRDVTVSYGTARAIREVDLAVYRNEITAFIGPSGCGKTTLLRCFNRTNDLIIGARVDGVISYEGQDLYGKDVDAVQVRRRIGMVFQKPKPFPKSN